LREAIPPFSLKRLRRLIDLTGEARDAAVMREALREALDVRERRAARKLLRMLRRRELLALKHIARALEHVRPQQP